MMRRRFDLAALGLPRTPLDPTPEGALLDSLQTADPDADVTLEMLEAHAATVQPLSPFLFVVGGQPTVLVNLDGITDADPAELAHAVTEGRCLLTAVYRSLPTYPVLCFMLLVYDGHFPYRFDGVRDVTTPDVQDFTAALCRDGGRGRVLLHSGPAGRRLAAGTFTYRQTPFARADLPYRTRSAELRRLWETLGIAGTWLRTIPAGRRDFGAAADAFLEQP